MGAAQTRKPLKRLDLNFKLFNLKFVFNCKFYNTQNEYLSN